MEQLNLNLVTCPHCGSTFDSSIQQRLKILDHQIEKARQERCAAWRRVNEYVGPDARELIKLAADADGKYENLVQRRFKMTNGSPNLVA